MELKVGAPFALVWRNDELSNPSGQRPAGFSNEHRMQSRITELDPPRKLAIAWKAAATFLSRWIRGATRCCSP
jgi:uncharacterized protein YndB with AHSA1/START domain